MRTKTDFVRDAAGRARDLLAVYGPTAEALELATESLRNAQTPSARRYALHVLFLIRAAVPS